MNQMDFNPQSLNRNMINLKKNNLKIRRKMIKDAKSERKMAGAVVESTDSESTTDDEIEDLVVLFQPLQRVGVDHRDLR